jgi:hypothetical protein
MQSGAKICQQEAQGEEGARGRRMAARGGWCSPESTMEACSTCGLQRRDSTFWGELRGEKERAREGGGGLFKACLGLGKG